MPLALLAKISAIALLQSGSQCNCRPIDLLSRDRPELIFINLAETETEAEFIN